MRTLRPLRRAAITVTIVLSASMWYGCSDSALDPLAGPETLKVGAADVQGLQNAIAAQERHTQALLRTPGVVGTAVGFLPSGRIGVRIFVTHPGVPNLPSVLDGIPTAREVTGMLVAFSDPTTRQRPAPVGFSVGHPAITAGTIGARVVDGSGNVYILSNNHVLANSNDALIGDPAYQPGPFDGGTAGDQIATLFAFQALDFAGGLNTIDAAIASSNTTDLGNATPSDDGYGAPSSAIFGDANGDGFFDDKTALLGLAVQKYGRTTGLTTGQITGINAQLTICYEVQFIFCVKPATFVDQLIIEPAGFSGGGDSGSLIVTSDGNNSPVGLLFAGNETQTIANRIDLVLDHFGVAIDGTPPGPPLTDVAVTGVSATSEVVQGNVAGVNVTVRNAGNQNVTSSFNVVLVDDTDGVTVGTQSVKGLAPGATTTVSFDWNTAGSSIGTHTLTAHHELADDEPSNDQSSTTIIVNDVPVPVLDLAVTNVAAVPELVQGNIAGVNVTVRNVGDLSMSSTFNVTVIDATDGVTVGSKSIAGLAVGAQTMVTINWNTAQSSLGLHTLIGRHEVPDANASNDEGSTTVRVKDASGNSPITDIAVTGVSATSVLQGDIAPVTVTVENVGNQDVTATFAVTLVDDTDGVTIGTQSVAGLAAGATTTVTIDWNTAASSIGSHSLTASHDLADEDAANDQASTIVTVNDPGGPTPVTDIAVTSVTAVPELVRGSIAGVNVTVRNMGNQAVGATFTVTVADATDGVTAGSKTVAGLAVGAQTTVTINWNTTGSSVGPHTITGTHDFADEGSSNDQGSTTVTVTDPGGTPGTDLAVTNVAAHPELVQGNIGGVNITVRNLGSQNVGTAFNVILVDVTDGVTVGSQNIAGLAVGAQTTVTINWNTATSSLGLHTLTANHDFPDDDPSNDAGSTTVRVTDPSGGSPTTDLAVTSLSAASVLQGDVTPVAVMVENVGNQDVTTPFNVIVTDATDGVTVGSQSVAGLAAGATTTVAIDWNTAASSIGTHTLTATHDLADENAANDQASIIATVNDPGGPPPFTDLAVTNVAAVPQLVQGNIAGVNVTVRNVGDQAVGATFTVTVIDATDGVTVSSTTIAGLAVGAQTMVTINWNTATSSLGLHTLTGHHEYPDDDPTNDQGSTTVRVTDPSGGSPITDLAVTGVSTGSVTQGDVAPVTVTVENVGNQDVATPFVVTLVDDTDAITIGSQSVAGLTAGATTTVTIDWNTTGSTIGSHTLAASHDLADENAANDQQSTIVTVNEPTGPPAVTDLAVTNVAAVSQLVRGSIAGVNVTVGNVGNQNVGATFTVTVVDATDGVTVGSTTVAGLGVGAQTTVTINWNTAGSSIGTHTLTASHDYADDDASNDQGSTTVTVTAPAPPPEIHVGDLDGTGINNGSRWSGTVEITVHDPNHGAVTGARVVGSWSRSTTATTECTTGGSGTCTVSFSGLRKRVQSITFTVTSVTLAGQTYVASQNHDPDGSSNGTAVSVNKP